jgi:Flp pilus assembly protein CpaB
VVETTKERSNVKPSKATLDESKLTPPQREALAIAKAQGKDLSLTLQDLKGDMDPEAVEEVMAVVMDLRKRPAKQRDF